MISIQQWRAVIGGFCPRRRKTKSTYGIVIKGQTTRQGLKIILALSLCIILAGDVETNPGPTIDDVLSELREFRLAIDKNFESLRSEISTLKTDMNSVRQHLDSVNEKIVQTTQDIDQFYDEYFENMKSIRVHVERLEKKVESQERYSRRDNLLFHNIPSDRDETNEQTKQKLLKILNDKVNSKVWSAESDFVRVHRLKTKSSGKQPVIARFVTTDDKFRVLKERAKLKDIGVGVSTDLTPAQREELNFLKSEGKKGYYKNGRLIVENNSTVRTETTSSGNPAVSDQQRAFQFGGSQRGFPGRGFRRNNNRGRTAPRGRGGAVHQSYDASANSEVNILSHH